MKNLKKRVERLEKIITPRKPLEVPEIDESVTINLDDLKRLREFAEKLGREPLDELAKRHRYGIPDPPPLTAEELESLAVNIKYAYNKRRQNRSG